VEGLSHEAVMAVSSSEDGPPVEVDRLVSYALDVWLSDIAILTDAPALRVVLRDAAAAGKAHVLNEAVHNFPNGAVTVALVLSQSHLTIHTWPEFRMANVDLLAYGLLNGQAIIDHVIKAMSATRSNLSRLVRDVM
jgi:S-adenosylmethionine decarboxylase